MLLAITNVFLFLPVGFLQRFSRLVPEFIDKSYVPLVLVMLILVRCSYLVIIYLLILEVFQFLNKYALVVCVPIMVQSNLMSKLGLHLVCSVLSKQQLLKFSRTHSQSLDQLDVSLAILKFYYVELLSLDGSIPHHLQLNLCQDFYMSFLIK